MKPCSSRISAGDQDLPDGCLSQAPSFCYHFNGTQQSGHSEPSKLQHFTTTRLPCDKRRLESLVSPAQSLTGRLMFLTHAVSRTCHAHTHITRKPRHMHVIRLDECLTRYCLHTVHVHWCVRFILMLVDLVLNPIKLLHELLGL